MVPILEIRGLQVSFATGMFRRSRDIRAVAGVDLAVQPGDSLGLVGESGCGKTTLARCALLLQKPAAGSIFFDGSDLGQLPAAELRMRRRYFQMIFQDSFGALNPAMTVEEILLEPFETHSLHKQPFCRDRILELLLSVALDSSILSRHPAELSGGQQQRIAIARALALKPRLLVADEPVSALDASVQVQILNLLADIRRRFGLTLILISHSLPAIQYLCGRIAVMYLGRIVEEALAEDFFLAPRHPYSRALLDSMPVMDSKSLNSKRILPGDVPSPANPPSGCAFHPRCPKAIARCQSECPANQVINNARVACHLPEGLHSQDVREGVRRL
jgi:peptide/nickel transport system ATP-binding protein